jgi:hypothetical protein
MVEFFRADSLYPVMPPSSVDALVDAAADGIDFEGLTVEADEEGYRLQTPKSDHSGLSAAELGRVAMGSRYLENWYFWHAIAPQRDDYWTFLRWIEDAPVENVHGHDGSDGSDVGDRYERLESGIDQSWGELLVTAMLDGEGTRTYRLQHGDDANTAPEGLDVYTEASQAQDLAKFDDREQYRPLKTAPNLRSGWLFENLDAEQLLTAIGYLYPASVENWYAEQMDDLDVTHWRETVSRQTGMYRVVDTWDRGEGHEHVEWVARTCCDDSQCLKRREWQYEDDTTLDADGGDGRFPCREPCSLVISAARTWSRMAGEQSQTYEFELTPSEKEQLETIIDAVADGTVDDIREADFTNDANRWRVRYLREKLFNEDGQLPDKSVEGSDEQAE